MRAIAGTQCVRKKKNCQIQISSAVAKQSDLSKKLMDSKTLRICSNVNASTTIASAAAADGSTCYCFIATSTAAVIFYLSISESPSFFSCASSSKTKLTIHDVLNVYKEQKRKMKWEFAAKMETGKQSTSHICLWLTHKTKE